MTKGISPLIAAVLLIAFTIAVAAIVGSFFTAFTKTTTGGVETQTRGATECAGVYIDVVTYNSTNGNAVFRNPSNSNIYVTAAVNDTGNTNNNLNLKIPPGSVANATTLTANSKVSFTGFCESTGGNVSITGECRKGQSCWTS